MVPNFQPPDSQSDFCFVRADDPEQGVERVLQVVTERIPQRFGFDPVRDIQVLTPMNRGELGARSLNQLLQAKLNPPGDRKSEVERFAYIA